MNVFLLLHLLVCVWYVTRSILLICLIFPYDQFLKQRSLHTVREGLLTSDSRRGLDTVIRVSTGKGNLTKKC